MFSSSVPNFAVCVWLIRYWWIASGAQLGLCHQNRLDVERSQWAPVP